MSSSHNSIIPFVKARIEDLQETIGITQFPTEHEWYQVLGGIIVQGGYVEVAAGATAGVTLPIPYDKQLLGVWIQPVGAPSNTEHINSVSLAGFEIVNGAGDKAYYWLSLGV